MLGGSLDTSEVQFSFINLACYFLLDFGNDEFMIRSQQLLLSNIHITIAAKSQSVLLTQYTTFYPNLKKMFSVQHSGLSPVIWCE